MKQSEAKDFWPLIKEWAEGKTLQWRTRWSDKWSDYEIYDVCEFSDPPHEYRIKPTPTLRPWKPKEVPVGVLLHQKGIPYNKYLITSVICDGVYYILNSTVMFQNFKDLYSNFEYSLDQGKTWLPCGVEE